MFTSTLAGVTSLFHGFYWQSAVTAPANGATLWFCATYYGWDTQVAVSASNALNFCTTWTWSSASAGALSGTAFYCGTDMTASGATTPAAGTKTCAADVTTTSLQVSASWY